MFQIAGRLYLPLCSHNDISQYIICERHHREDPDSDQIVRDQNTCETYKAKKLKDILCKPKDRQEPNDVCGPVYKIVCGGS